MKIIILIAAITLFSLPGISQSTCATSFKVNNGNGTCGAAGELRLTFPGSCPALVPAIDSVYINGVKSNVTFAAPDASKCGGNNGYVSYCVTSGNMPPVNVWSIYFKDAQSIFNCTVMSTNTSTLAVKLVSFDAAAAGNSIMCKWISQETDNNHFEVERSFDGRNFNSIAYVFSKENLSAGNNSYSYNDKAIALQGHNKVFYRLKDVDRNGSVSFSDIISIKLAANFAKGLQVSPSPFSGSLSIIIESTSNGAGEIKILNLSGQPVVTKNATVSKGSNIIQLDNLNGLAKGVYVAQVSINGVVAGNQKVIKN